MGKFKSKKFTSLLLVAVMIITLLPNNLVSNAMFATDTNGSPKSTDTIEAGTLASVTGSAVVFADGTVRFGYQGDGTEPPIYVKGEGIGAVDWDAPIALSKDADNYWSVTTAVKKDPGIYHYGLFTSDNNGLGQLTWLGDPANPCGDSSNRVIVRNPVVDNITGAVTIRYSAESTDNKVKVQYRKAGTQDAYTDVPMKQDAAISHMLSASILAPEAGEYEYVINDNSVVKPDDFNVTTPGKFTAPAVDPSLQPDNFAAQPGGNSTWRVTGKLISGDDWTIANPNTIMKHLVGEYYAISTVVLPGTYEFKFTKNGDWAGAVGSNGNPDNSANFKLTFAKKSKVNLYLNDELGNAANDSGKAFEKVRISVTDEDGNTTITPGAGDSAWPVQYTPVLDNQHWPRFVGDLQTEIGDDNDWLPEKAKSMFVDYYFDNSVYKLQRTLPKGTYGCKVLFGSTWPDGSNGFWDCGGPDGNLGVNILDNSADVTFSIDTKAAKKELSHNYKPKDSIYDGVIDKSKLYFDSRSTTYKSPFGAVKQGSEDVTFRLAAKAMDAQYVKLELINGQGVSKTYNMSVATTIGEKDYWEVIVPKAAFDKIGIWGYKFIVLDGSEKFEYGDDGISGGTGSSAAEGQLPYNLTVYAADYKTPDWMKDAVVYQIFPDRFFDGDSSNNHAKDVDGVRGKKPQLFDGENWSVIPENPRQSEPANKPYYPDATTDGVWSNEFYGGDIAGIEQKLDYLQNLGVTAIYLNPVSWAASNHKYDATDYKHLDPMFGKPVYNTAGDPKSGLNYEETKKESDKVYNNLAKACKAKGMQLISDGVFNHVGDDSIYFDRYENYPEIGAYEYWSRVYDEMNDNGTAQDAAELKVKNHFKSLINTATGENYTDADFNYINWFDIRNKKVSATSSESNGEEYYEYEGWWGYDSLPVIKTVEASNTNLSNDDNATIAGAHEYNNVDYRNNVIGYDLNKMASGDVSAAMQNANSQRWLWMGASGWRLDVAPDVSTETWQQFRTAVKSAAGKTDVNGDTISDPVILGEEWGVATRYLLGDTFDSVMNYQFRAALQNFLVNSGDAVDFNNSLEVIRENYPKEAWQAMLNLVDSHDTVRNITKIDNPSWEEENTKIAPEASERAIKLQKLTAIFQMSYPGAPTIYYGDEVGVVGTKDPDSRRTFPWERINGTNISSSASAKYGSLYQTYVSAAKVRNDNKDIFATGDIKNAYAKGSVIAYARKSDTKGGLSVINRGEEEVTFDADVTDFLPNGLTLADELGSGITATVAAGKISVTIPAYTGLMMVSTSDITALPAVPSNLAAVAADGANASVLLTWDSVPNASYKIYRTLLDGMDAEEIGTSAANSYTDSAVVNGTRYYYYVKSVVSGIESLYSKSATAVPSFNIDSISAPSALNSIEIGVGKKTDETSVTIMIAGLTDDPAYANKEVPGLNFTLVYYTGDNKSTAQETKLRYKNDEADGSKVYTAAFEPTEEGTYSYFAKATVNNGVSYKESAAAAMTATTAPGAGFPAAPVVTQPIEESNRVTLNWTAPSSGEADIDGFDIYRTSGDITLKMVTLEKDVRSYIDYSVDNDTSYQYKVVAFSKAYKRADSNTVSVTPKLVMVDVTVRLTIPQKVYTSATDNIYIASGENGWNASGWLLKKPSGATDNNIVEYSFKMMSGKTMEYKYTRGSWDSEALTGKTENDLSNPGNYGYSSTDTNIKLTIKNQGGNKMLVEDTVLRWVDMPLMITIPRISYGKGDISYTTEDESFDLVASVPYGGIFTINGKNINEMQQGALDKYGNVKLDKVPLKEGENVFKLHISPTDETKAQPWLTDTGRIDTQMTADKKITITRTTSGGSSGGNTGGSTGTPSTPEIPSVPEENGDKPENKPATDLPTIGGKEGWDAVTDEIKNVISKAEGTGKQSTVTIDMGNATDIPVAVLKTAAGKNVKIKLKMDGYSWTINGKSVSQKLLNNLPKGQDSLELSISEVKNSVTISKLKAATKQSPIQNIKVNYDGKLPFDASVMINVGKSKAGKNIFISSYDTGAKKVVTYAYAKVDSVGDVNFTIPKGSFYTITAGNPNPPAAASAKTLGKGKASYVAPKNILKGDKVTYKTSSKSVVTVGSNGKLTAKKSGKATITTTIVQAGKKYTIKMQVTVK